ncbi:MAG TPA: cation diffusion facilitator family transporter [Burkholderiales bacterium]|nr:cation diffusion facilitator family transporter [Burkholderiales bacterium]
MSSGADSLKSILFALGANVAIAVAKFIGAAITGSSAMLAEAIHSIADSGNQLLLILGLRHARRPPTPDYPLGYGKAIYFWSFIVALILFSMGGLFSIYEGVHKLRHPEPLSSAWIAIVILMFSIGAECVSLWGCIREIDKVRGDRTLWRWFRETRQSELVVVLGEDLAALTGLVLALAAVVLSAVTGNPLFDALGSLAIGALLIIVAIAIGIEVQGMLIGQSMELREQQAIRGFLLARDEIADVLNLITLQLGGSALVAVKVRMTETADAGTLLESINRCEQALRQAFPRIQWLFFEPDVAD